jgi:hypothetical protein
VSLIPVGLLSKSVNEHRYSPIEKAGESVLASLKAIDVIDLFGEVGLVVKASVVGEMPEPRRELRSFVHIQLVVVVLAMESATKIGTPSEAAMGSL